MKMKIFFKLFVWATLLSGCGQVALAQQNYFAPGVPPSSNSFAPTFRYITGSADSLNSLFLGLGGNKWYRVGSTTNYFQSTMLTGSGTFSDPFGIANNYITPAMLYSISGVPGAGTVYYGDGHWGAISGGGDSTIYKVDGSITDAIRNVNIGANQLNFIAKSGSDSTAVNISAAGGIFFDTYDITNHVEGIVSIFHGSPYLEASDSTSISDLFTSSSGNHSETTMQVVDKSTTNAKRIQMGTAHSGYIPGIIIADDIDHIGLIGGQIFPVYSGKQYAQYHGVDSIAKAKADSVKGTISSGGVSTFNSRAGAVSLLSSDVTTALGFTPYNATNPSSYISRTGLSATSPIFYNSSTGVISSQAASGSQAGYLTSADWSTFNGKQAALTFDTTPTSGSTNPVTSGGIYTYVTTSIGADGIVTGLVTTTVTTTATTTSGTYRLNNLLVVKSSSTNTTIPAQDATLNRYVLIVADASGVFSVVTGTLAADAVEPDIPANKALIASIYIPATGGTVTTGGGGTGKGTVTKVTSSTTDILVANQTTTPILTLNKVNGVAISFYDPTSSIQTQINSKLSTTTASTTYVPLTRTVNGKALSSNITLGLASSDFANQGTTTGLLHGNASGNPSFGPVVNADITNSTIDLTTKVTGLLPVANGGTGTSTPGIVAGTNITVSGTWPNQTINSTGGSSFTPVSGETPSGSLNGSNLIFTAAHTPISGSLTVIYNGLILQPIVDYTLSTATATLVLTGHLSSAPVSTDYIIFNYQY